MGSGQTRVLVTLYMRVLCIPHLIVLMAFLFLSLQRNFSSMAQDIRLDQAKRTFCVDLSPETLERAAAEDDECPLQAGSVSRGP